MHDENEIEKLPDAVREISQLAFSGNIIPNSWFQHVVDTTEKGNVKAHLLAINILAEIVYWYRWVEERHAGTGKTIGFRKKFKADMLQKSYAALAEKFGQSKIVVKREIDLLVKLGLIRRKFKHIMAGELKLGNVMYLEPIPDRIAAITYALWREDTPPSLQKSKDLLTKKLPPPGKKVKTYTKSTAKSTAKILSTPSPKKKNPKNRVFMIPETLAERFTDAGNVSFLNQPDAKIIPALFDYLKNDGKRDNLETDVDIFFQFAGQESVSAVLVKKLNNISFILDKFDAEQYRKGRELAGARDGDKKLSYLRKVLEKAFRPKPYTRQRSLKNKNTTRIKRRPPGGQQGGSGRV